MLLRNDVPASDKEEVAARIDDAWEALARCDVATEKKRRLLEAVDCVAHANDKKGWRAAGEAVLAELPPELGMSVAPHIEDLGHLVEAWRRGAGAGRRPGGAMGKWSTCVALWRRATGEATTTEVWRALWKEVRPAPDKKESGVGGT